MGSLAKMSNARIESGIKSLACGNVEFSTPEAKAVLPAWSEREVYDLLDLPLFESIYSQHKFYSALVVEYIKEHF
jgi:hypothetical protein